MVRRTLALPCNVVMALFHLFFRTQSPQTKAYALFPLAPAMSCDHARSAQPAFRASYRQLHVLQYPKFAQHHVLDKQQNRPLRTNSHFFVPYFPSAPQLTKLVCLPPAFKKQFMTKMMRWQKPVFTNNRIRTQADMALRKKLHL
jgi:hypothetical protein